MLRKHLQALHIDATSLEAAAIQSIENPTMGYDGRYGKSAIKTFRSFLYPKQTTPDDDPIKLNAAAARCAQQIDFLLKRHKSHEADWVRHHDDPTNEQRPRRSFPLILVLDNVRSAFNVGSIFRTADAVGCRQVITTGITPHPNGSGAEKLRKSALGADLLVDSRHFVTTRDAIAWLRTELPEYRIIGMETTAQSVLYTDYEYPLDNNNNDSGVVLVLGNEVTGVDTEVMKDLDAIVEIPMFGAKNSLNIAACAPIVLYEIIRQWSLRKE